MRKERRERGAGVGEEAKRRTTTTNVDMSCHHVRQEEKRAETKRGRDMSCYDTFLAQKRVGAEAGGKERRNS